MEIDVTHMVENANQMSELSGSQMEHGRDAGSITWNNALEYGREQPLLTTDEERDAAREHFVHYGAWSREEIAAWSEDELQGIMCQDVAAAIREMEHYPDPDEYREARERGECSGDLYQGDSGRWYFYLGI